jgi:antitoxin HicB
MNKHIGSKFDDFLAEEKLLDEAEAVAIKRVLSYQIKQELKKKHMAKATLAKRMNTSRTALDRLLDPDNTGVTLRSLVKAARVLGKKIKFSFA